MFRSSRLQFVDTFAGTQQEIWVARPLFLGLASILMGLGHGLLLCEGFTSFVAGVAIVGMALGVTFPVLVLLVADLFGLPPRRRHVAERPGAPRVVPGGNPSKPQLPLLRWKAHTLGAGEWRVESGWMAANRKLQCAVWKSSGSWPLSLLKLKI